MSSPDFGIGIAVIGFWLFFILLGIVGTIFWIIELVDVMRREFADSNLKLIWVLVILLGHFIGSLVYFFVGRQQGQIPRASPRWN
jgi:hypothetical protein